MRINVPRSRRQGKAPNMVAIIAGLHAVLTLLPCMFWNCCFAACYRRWHLLRLSIAEVCTSSVHPIMHELEPFLASLGPFSLTRCAALAFFLFLHYHCFVFYSPFSIFFFLHYPLVNFSFFPLLIFGPSRYTHRPRKKVHSPTVIISCWPPLCLVFAYDYLMTALCQHNIRQWRKFGLSFMSHYGCSASCHVGLAYKADALVSPPFQ